MRWTPEKVEKLRALAETGYSAREVGAMFGVRRDAVSQVAKRHKVSFHGQSHRQKADPIKPFDWKTALPAMKKQLHADILRIMA